MAFQPKSGARSSAPFLTSSYCWRSRSIRFRCLAVPDHRRMTSGHWHGRVRISSRLLSKARLLNHLVRPWTNGALKRRQASPPVSHTCANNWDWLIHYEAQSGISSFIARHPPLSKPGASEQGMRSCSYTRSVSHTSGLMIMLPSPRCSVQMLLSIASYRFAPTQKCGCPSAGSAAMRSTSANRMYARTQNWGETRSLRPAGYIRQKGRDGKARYRGIGCGTATRIANLICAKPTDVAYSMSSGR